MYRKHRATVSMFNQRNLERLEALGIANLFLFKVLESSRRRRYHNASYRLFTFSFGESGPPQLNTETEEKYIGYGSAESKMRASHRRQSDIDI